MASPLRISETGRRPLRVLALGAHSDDIEIGCGGTILTLCRARRVEMTWVVVCASEEARATEARSSAAAFLAGCAESEVVLGGFRDAYLPGELSQVKDFVHALRERCEPDLVLTHQRNDLHQDHRVVCELTWNAFRDDLILEYEIPKWDGDLGAPAVYVPLDAEVAERKVELLLEHFGSQRSKDWFRPEVFASLMRLRAVECRAHEGYAEAFYGRKLTVDLR